MEIAAILEKGQFEKNSQIGETEIVLINLLLGGYSKMVGNVATIEQKYIPLFTQDDLFPSMVPRPINDKETEANI